MSTENEFDMSSALDTISSDLFGGDDLAEGGTDVDLEVTLPVEEAAPLSATETVLTTTESAEVPSSAPITAPKTWRKEAQAEWEKLPPTVKAEVLKREEDMFRGLEGYKQEATFGKSVTNALARHMPTLQQYGIDPVQQISGLMDAHHTLAFGDPATKAALFQKIAADYGVDLRQFADQEAPFTDPQVKTLMEHVKSLESKLSSYETTQQTQTLEKTKAEIDSFLSDPAYPYAKELTADMAQIITAGMAKDLKGAYEKAIWQNPTVRAKELARQQKESAEQTRVKTQQTAEAAKKAAGATVTTTSKDASRTAPKGTMDDTLQQTLAEIKSRT